jgi:ribosomal protein S18 acetylase RimI-like enzyme
MALLYRARDNRSEMLYRAVEENLRVAMRCYARISDLGEAREYPGLSVAFCGLPCSVFNSALLSEPAEEAGLRRLVTLADVHFGQRQVGWTLWLCEDLLLSRAKHSARSLMCDIGLDPIAQPPGMYADRLEPPRRQIRSLQIRRVEDERTRLDFAHLSSVIFSLPFHTARAVYGSAGLWAAPMTGWIGYFQDQAVSIVCVVIGAGAAGVYSVGTLPAFQGRGFAETLIRHALAHARESAGSDVSVLQSTAQGITLYSRMGFRTVTRFGVYINERGRRN